MNQHNTLLALQESLSDSNRSHLLEALRHQPQDDEIALDLVQLRFDFRQDTVTVSYVVSDPEYPSVDLSFEQFEQMLLAG